MDTGLYFQMIFLMFVAAILILAVKKFDYDKMEPWDYVLFFFAGPLWPIIFPVIFVYLGIYIYKDRSNHVNR